MDGEFIRTVELDMSQMIRPRSMLWTGFNDRLDPLPCWAPKEIIFNNII